MSRFKAQDYQVTEKIKHEIIKNPTSDLAIAYRMGLKDKEVRLQPEIDKVLGSIVDNKNRLPGM